MVASPLLSHIRINNQNWQNSASEILHEFTQEFILIDRMPTLVHKTQLEGTGLFAPKPSRTRSSRPKINVFMGYLVPCLKIIELG